MSNALRALAAQAKLSIALAHSVHQAQTSLGFSANDLDLFVVNKMQRASCPRFVESIEVQGIISSSMYPDAPDIAFFHDRETRAVAVLPYSTREMAVHQCATLLESMEGDLDMSIEPDFPGKFVPMEFRLLDQFDDLVAVGVIHNRAIDWLTPGPSLEVQGMRQKASETSKQATQLAHVGQVAAAQTALRHAAQLNESAELAENNLLVV
jgi:hypothetical protein